MCKETADINIHTFTVSEFLSYQG